ncbi:MAG: hypothetical protein A2W86_11785 [Bacteroidetes bacterium GWD2_45_23]|nr:MAG: hypothetical protein A2W87_08230 [Bacteroidetes bacterium GWC2_46_850]OFX70123.1 MAG: hypothetical protein A2071_04560 [Bacteroidetes bacterium GWC1_47_7]OFX85502.1 MAG: hypothetical protein A2W86_11785 [Bacteroidetes bacterium GWD2_45_23]HBB00726.1 hypothetical protein [Porphyromonadaceae bacterium]HCC19351.1 hypothetical protein [Porphyromonadaceae bacterium]
MHFSEEQLKTIEEMSYRLFQPHLIAINLEVDEDEFIEEIYQKSLARTAFYKGIIRHENEIREQIIKAALNGSNPAQEQLIRLLQIFHSSLNE